MQSSAWLDSDARQGLIEAERLVRQRALAAAERKVDIAELAAVLAPQCELQKVRAAGSSQLQQQGTTAAQESEQQWVMSRCADLVC
jgi:hypothetical protein